MQLEHRRPEVTVSTTVHLSSRPPRRGRFSYERTISTLTGGATSLSVTVANVQPVMPVVGSQHSMVYQHPKAIANHISGHLQPCAW